MTTHEAPYAVRLKDYQPPHFTAKKISLDIELDPDQTIITSRVSYHHRSGAPFNLRLLGKELTLISASLDGRALDIQTIDWSSEHLQLSELPETFTLELKTQVNPRQNKALEGIYLSQNKFYSQCEPEGFRRLTYYLDRPDVMAEFETTLIASEKDYPVLLSNGNLIKSGKSPGGKHFAVWHDPFPKPSYLFAVVAGNLSRISDTFTTRSGREIALHIYVEQENIDKCKFAMLAIKRAMRWDEDNYQLEYDLDLFMVVAVSDFNMGAMENKGLNIFNAKYVLASPETATDMDFESILTVVGHEYFHNWTGNRVTLRDWFQLSLKEGLTVFRDQQFSADESSAPVKRIQSVKSLREHQFPEDNGPMAHAVRPESYIEINNFYTSTVYNKGAEIVRMLHGMLGPESYHRGIQLYFNTFDGQAVTIEDFLDVMGRASGLNLEQFKLWYMQAGTPHVKVTRSYKAQQKRLILTLTQSQGTNAQALLPLQIPVRLALISKKGKALISRYAGKSSHEHVLLFSQREHEFVLEEVEEDPIPSLFRNFSAPVIVDASLDRQDLICLLAHETDPFNRFEAAFTLHQQTIAKKCEAKGSTLSPKIDQPYLDALRQLLVGDASSDPRLVALALQPPSVDYMHQMLAYETIDELFSARQWLLSQVAEQLKGEFLSSYHRFHKPDDTAIDRASIGQREIKNACLALLSQLETPEIIELARQQLFSARNMTDSVAALSVLASSSAPAREESLDFFYRKWKNDPLVIDKWFAIQASSPHPDVLQHVRDLLKHPDFDILNPNRVYSVFRQFSRCIPHGFHHPSGEGYRIVADYALKIDKKNPQVAASLTNALSRYRNFDKSRQELMRAQLIAMRDQAALSRDVFEVVAKSLHD